MTDTVLYEKRGATVWITLNRPEALNAISEELRSTVPLAIARAEADDDVRVMVFTGAGERAFCAGADVKGFGEVGSLVKEAVRGSLETDLPTGLRIEADFSTLIASTEDRKEAGAAFREKRKPKFKGK